MDSLPQRVDDAFPQHVTNLYLDMCCWSSWSRWLQRCICENPESVQEERVKDITESKQAKDGGIEIAGVLVTLDPSPLSSILDYLVISNSVVLVLPVRDCIQS